MAAVVKLRLGNLFDGPCDLMVLPCSTDGTISGFVARALAQHSIPHPAGCMALGEVEFLPFEGGENLAQYVAFAASVRQFSSTPSAIEAIGRRLGGFTRQHPSVRGLSAPLLGAGAGGLRDEDVMAALKTGFMMDAAAGATLTIHVLDREDFARLRTLRSGRAQRTEKPVRVFLSHTSRTEEAVEWVKQLALFLIERGIQARLDRFHLRHGMDLPQWMCNELALADKVLIVCDEQYKLRADGRLGGVGWETMIIQGDMSKQPPDSTKYQIVVRAESLDSGLPMYLGTRFAFHATPSDPGQAFREELLRELLDLPLDARLEDREFVV